MTVALLFNPQHPTLGGIYSYTIMRVVLGTGVLQASNRHMRISRGDVITASIDVRHELYVPRDLDLLIPERADDLFRHAGGVVLANSKRNRSDNPTAARGPLDQPRIPRFDGR